MFYESGRLSLQKGRFQHSIMPISQRKKGILTFRRKCEAIARSDKTLQERYAFSP